MFVEFPIAGSQDIKLSSKRESAVSCSESYSVHEAHRDVFALVVLSGI